MGLVAPASLPASYELACLIGGNFPRTNRVYLV